MIMPLLGAHVSIAKSIDLAVDRAHDLGCDTFQMFSRSPRMWNAKALSQEATLRFQEKRKQYGIGPTVIHMPYLPNFASPDTKLHKRSVDTLAEELTRGSQLGCEMIVVHMGSHLGDGRINGLNQVVSTIQSVLNGHPKNGSPAIILENTAGYTNSVGSRFEDLSYVIETVNSPQHVGVCFDTCHGFAAGYDLRNPAAVNDTFDMMDSQLGLKWLKVLHLNDSKGDLGAHLDRHEHIGKGKIGLSGFNAILNYSSLRQLPMILETPDNKQGNMKTNLATLRSLVVNS